MMGMSDLVYWTNLFCIGCVSVGIIILMTLVRAQYMHLTIQKT